MASCSLLLYPLRRKHTFQCVSTELSKHRTLCGLQMSRMGFWLPVPGRAECRPPQLSAADDKGSSSWRPRRFVQRQHSKQKAEYGDRHRWAGFAPPDGRVWYRGGSDTCCSGSPFWLLDHLPWSISGRLFQGIDNLLKDVRAVISNLLKNGVSELLQLCIVPFHFLQLTLKLKGKREAAFRQRAPYLC